MNLFRRILGRSKQDSGRSALSRRASHVTPTRSQRSVEPVREAAPPEPELEVSPPTPIQEVIESEPPEPEEILDGEPATDTATRELQPKADSSPDLDPPAKTEPPPPPAPKQVIPPAPKPILTRQKQPLTYGIASDVGMMRRNNEDACFGMQWHSITVDNRPDFGFFVVADGMGGHLDGERAAGIAVQTLASEMLDKIYVPLLRNFNAGDSPTVLEALIAASERANLAVIKGVPGGGTTLSAVAIIGNLAYLVHVGDSRAYLIHNEKIEQLTTDHTLVQRLIEMNELTPEEAESYPQKNVLYRAIGQNEKLKMERLVRTLPASAQVLICTDGLWDMIEDEMIKRIALAADSPQEACDSLVKLANDRGGIDNVSCIVFKVPGGGDSG